MTLSLLIPMMLFALAASISPGPVNLMCLNSGTRHSLFQSLVFVTGATLGFIALFLTVGLGLYSALTALPFVSDILKWAGVSFLLYLSIQLFRDDGQLPESKQQTAPSFLTGAMMQWLNPKAWLASASGIGAYTNGNALDEIFIFALLYLPICWLSLSCWVYAGIALRRYISKPTVLIVLNRTLALLLAASCVYLLIE